MVSYVELKGLNNEKTLTEVLEKSNLFQKFVIQEKIHGSNISFRFDTERKMTIHSRNQQLEQTSKFFGFQEILGNYKIVENKIRDYLDKNEDIKTFAIFGEFFGGGIQKEIDYGPQKRILFFDIYINDEIVDYVTFRKIVDELGISEFCVEALAVVDNFKEALDFDIKFPTKYSTIAGNQICEGIVIKQYEAKVDKSFLLLCKRKNDTFLEKPVEKERKEQKEVKPKKFTLIDYVNANRIKSYLSKITNIDELNDEHVNNIIKDALKDFKIDFPDYEPDDSMKRNCKSKILGLFKNMK